MAISRSSQDGNLDPGPSMGSKRPISSTIFRRTAMPAPRPRTWRASCIVVNILSPVENIVRDEACGSGRARRPRHYKKQPRPSGVWRRLRSKFLEPFRRDRTVVIRDCDDLAFGLCRPAFSAFAFADGRRFSCTSGGERSEWPQRLQRFVVLALMNNDQLENCDACLPGWTIQCPPPSAPQPHVQTSADISGGSSCLNCPPTDVANYASTAVGCICAVPLCKIGRTNTPLCQDICAHPLTQITGVAVNGPAAPATGVNSCASPSPVLLFRYLHAHIAT